MSPDIRGALALVAVLVAGCSSTRTTLPDPVPTATPDSATERPPDRTTRPPAVDPTTEDRPEPDAPCQLAETPAPAPWYVDAVFYEIFVRSFQDSDADGIGDLQGLISRLDYLQGLGITALWLMPINKSPSYHGYDVTDYRDINPDYGTLADFDALIAAADKRGIRVVMDLVINHTSRQHPWFVKAKRGPEQPRNDWYVWSDKAHDWGKPWDPKGDVWHVAGSRFYYGLFSPNMPDLNFQEAAVQAEIKDIAAFWLARGAAGFRLDAARYLVESGQPDGQADQPDTHAFWRTMRSQLQTAGSDALLVGEVWTDLKTTATYFGQSDELHMLFGFDRADATRDALRLGVAAGFTGRLCEEMTLAANGVMGSFLTNHDLDRFATDVIDPAALKLSATLLLTLPGTPFIYYGEELGLANGPAMGDIAKRLPMRWDDTPHHGFTTGEGPWETDKGNKSVPDVAAQLADATSLLSHYKALIQLRRAHPALSRGSAIRVPVTSDGGSLLAVLRATAEERILLVFNLGKSPAKAVTPQVDGATIDPFDLAPATANVIHLTP